MRPILGVIPDPCPEVAMSVLDGYRVLDLSVAMAGPLAAMRLGDLGADVIKVEPVTGEWQRHTAAGGATGNEINASFLSLNRNKRSLAVNLKSPEGRDLVHELATTSDVFLQNYRPGVAARLGVDYETISAINPEIVYVSISGYGESGPYVGRPGQDVLVQAMTGALHSAGKEGEAPQPGPYFVADAITAYSAFEGALAALLHRERTGEGQLVQVNMLDAMIAMQMQELSVRTVGGVRQTRVGDPRPLLHPRAVRHLPDQRRLPRARVRRPHAACRRLRRPDPRAWDGERDGFPHRDEISRRVTMNLRTDTTQYVAGPCSASEVSGSARSTRTTTCSTIPRSQHNQSFVTYQHPTEGEVTYSGLRLPAVPDTTSCDASRPDRRSGHRGRAGIAGVLGREHRRTAGVEGHRMKALRGITWDHPRAYQQGFRARP